MSHFPIDTAIVVNETGPRGITVRASASNDHMHVLLHNGCGRGNMRSIMTNEQGVDLALAILKVARREAAPR